MCKVIVSSNPYDAMAKMLLKDLIKSRKCWLRLPGCVNNLCSSGGVLGNGASRTLPLEQHNPSASCCHRCALQCSHTTVGSPRSCASSAELGNASSMPHLKHGAEGGSCMKMMRARVYTGIWNGTGRYAWTAYLRSVRCCGGRAGCGGEGGLCTFGAALLGL